MSVILLYYSEFFCEAVALLSLMVMMRRGWDSANAGWSHDDDDDDDDDDVVE